MSARTSSILAGLLVTCLLLVAAPARAQQQVVDRIVAVVNGEIVTLFDLNKEFAPILARFKGREFTSEEEEQLNKIKRELLDKMVDDILLRQEVEHYGINVSQAELDTHLQRIRNEYGLSEEDFKQQLAMQNLSDKEFEDKIKQDILKHRLLSVMVQRKVLITEQEIEEYYEAHKDEYTGNREVGLGIILLPPEVSGSELYQRISSGEISFADAAKEYSVGPGAEAGGDIGMLTWPQLAPEWKDALRGMSEGDVSQPVMVNGREALLQLRTMSAGDAKPLDDVREEIRELLLEPKYEKQFSEYMQKLRDKAIIEYKM